MPSKKAPARSTPRRTVAKKPKITVEHVASSPDASGRSVSVGYLTPPTARTSTKPDDREIIEVELVREEHEVLLSMGILDDDMMAVVKRARSSGNGVVLMKGKRMEIDELAGWVAGECNHEAEKKGGSRRRALLLSDACDAIEAALR